jgi:hypothetical protein
MIMANLVVFLLLAAFWGSVSSCRSEKRESAFAEKGSMTESMAQPAAPPSLTPPKNSVKSKKWTGATELLGVGLGADGKLIAVKFRMDSREARGLQQGNVYVVDEKTQRAYRQVTVMPKVGPLISRPKLPGQTGYAMLTNAPEPLQAGAVVTVMLGKYKQEHVRVQ